MSYLDRDTYMREEREIKVLKERIAKLKENLLHEYTCAVGRGLTEEQAKEALKEVT